ncbi:hypothetical protein GCM10027055_15740 [Janibacter alkaliphilus]|uniref:DUF2550 family protein n=1 Tax=Janibacter alkaliphilus TaxID=1069963 RepID=A0A852XFV8_9MICO|nr:DUF2550 family protein [Janibacter alkaliphilus]NYG37435.1 hypothetical protein [Janibacter alkaliphilus]
MSTLQLTEILLAAGCLLVLAWLALILVRRRRIGALGPIALCAVRLPGRPRWRLGLLRLGPEGLGWFSVTGVTTRPRLLWPRDDLEISTPQDEQVSVPGLERPVAISLHGPAGHLADLAVERQVYFTVRSWLESAPPGHGVNVA